MRVPRLPQAGEDLEVEPTDFVPASSRTSGLRRRFRPTEPPVAQARPKARPQEPEAAEKPDAAEKPEAAEPAAEPTEDAKPADG